MNNQTNFASKATDRTTDVWLTPRHILAPLGEFDLDPCAAPDPTLWPTAKRHICWPQDGRLAEWGGQRVWLNPPYSDAMDWLEILARPENNDGIALVFARTETKGFFSAVWGKATGLLFVKGRLSFHLHDGTKGGTAGAPSVLVAYGIRNANLLEHCAMTGKITGKFINPRATP